jgi:hypothetical protein
MSLILQTLEEKLTPQKINQNQNGRLIQDGVQ